MGLDLILVSVSIRPGICQVRRTQRRISRQQFSLARPKPPCLDEQPHRDTRPHDARLPTVHRWITFDAGIVITEITCHPLEYLGFLRPTQMRQQSFHILKRTDLPAYTRGTLTTCYT